MIKFVNRTKINQQSLRNFILIRKYNKSKKQLRVRSRMCNSLTGLGFITVTKRIPGSNLTVQSALSLSLTITPSIIVERTTSGLSRHLSEQLISKN